MTWEPIETAPRDGTEILTWDGSEYLISLWKGDGWLDPLAYTGDGRIEPTHWQPSPPPPA